MRNERSLTMELAKRVCRSASRKLPIEVQHASQRAMLNSLATAIAGRDAPAVASLLELGRVVTGQATASVPGRGERFDCLVAAVLTGAAGHVHDFDDTHLPTYIHPGPTLVGTVLPIAEWNGNSGAEVLAAFALGCEVELRVGLALTLEHYKRGWHITGTCGVIGAAVAASLLLQLNDAQLAAAIGIAASQTLGHQEGLGTAEKAFHAGKAASNGILAALLAQAGFASTTDSLGAHGGFLEALSHAPRREELERDFDDDWELFSDAFKPYPCAIVCHPAIDAACDLATRLEPTEIDSIVVRCHPMVFRLVNNPNPINGLRARLSIAHGVSVALLDGHAGLRQYEDARVTAEDVRLLRKRVSLQQVDEFAPDEAAVEVRLASGVRLDAHVPHAKGSRDRPLTDAELRAKVTTLIEPVLPGRSEQILAAMTDLSTALTISSLLEAVTP